MKTDSNTINEFFTVGELAEYFCVSSITIRRLVENRKITFHKIGGSIRFFRKDVKDYLDLNCTKSVDG
jgi:excisionase family DNA binding protein